MGAIKNSMSEEDIAKMQYNSNFERFEYFLQYHLYSYEYFTINLLPMLCFFVDKQMNETWVSGDGILYESYIGIGFHFDWLGLSMGFQVNFKTNKPLED